MTKEKFTRALETAAHDVAREKHIQKKERLKQVKNSNVTESYTKLKKGLMLLVHLIIAFNFFLVWTEATIHNNIHAAIQEYMSEVKNEAGHHLNLKNIPATYLEPMLTIKEYNINQIGSNFGVIDKESKLGTLRLTYRLYEL